MLCGMWMEGRDFDGAEGQHKRKKEKNNKNIYLSARQIVKDVDVNQQPQKDENLF